MKRFDCLSLDCPVLGPHLLEASAGTGKTFAIEHVVVRLLLEGDPLHKILVVTFTRAATRELKTRILSNITMALAIVEGKQDVKHFLYLQPWVLQPQAILNLANALNAFDQAQIFTIHGFCQRILSEFPFEAGRWSIAREEHPTEVFQKAVFFLKKVFESPIDLCPEQLSLCLHECDTLYAWGAKLLQTKPKEKVIGFQEIHRELIENLPRIVPKEEIFADFENLRAQYKKEPDGVERQLDYILRCIEEPKDPMPFRKLLGTKGTICSFLDPQNRKVRSKETLLQHPNFWTWLQSSLSPIIAKATDQTEIFSVVAKQWHQFLEKHGKVRFEPDDLLVQMQNALKESSFVQAIKDRFSAAIIDEFQDTDPIQWDIFQTLFLDTKTLYLVGDPKQSIYRFRSADVYTYLAAKKALGESNLYHLDTNFRSSKELLDALNSLFSRHWLILPKEGTTLPYYPVNAGSSVASDLPDQKKALHWMISGEEGSFRDPFLPYTVQEIQKLGIYKGVAVLVKDRYELGRALSLFQDYQIPSVARMQERLADTYAFEATRELFSLLESPFNERKRKAVEMGPWKNHSEPWVFWRSYVQDFGLAKFFSAFGEAPLEDFPHVLEELFAWEKREGFSFLGIELFFQEFVKLEGKEAILRRSPIDEDAVQIMTLHMSKGLEFEIVFALGLVSTSSSQEDVEELNAEKLRQLYVAMTRAKKRLYVPLCVKTQEDSPIGLFCRCIEKDEGPMEAYLETLATVSKEFLPVPFPLPPIPALDQQVPCKEENEREPVFRRALYLESFTSLAKDLGTVVSVSKAPGEFPQGKEVGTLIHKVFEIIFQGDESVWKGDFKSVVQAILRPTFLEPWTDKIVDLVARTLTLPLQEDFCLCKLEKKNLYPEMEFFYFEEDVPIKGFIDLVFIHEGKLYFVDWKTNHVESMEDAMEAHAYPMQASLYKEALLRQFNLPWGGAFYIFVRTGGVVHLC